MSIESLTEREKECLRLLLQPLRVKGIARATGLSEHTVNDHLKSARRKLGASDSITAATMLRDYEDPIPNNQGPRNSGWSEPPPTPHEPVVEVTKSAPQTSPFAAEGRPWNDLSMGWRLVWPLMLMGAIAFGAGALLSGASSLTQLMLMIGR